MAPVIKLQEILISSPLKTVSKIQNVFILYGSTYDILKDLHAMHVRGNVSYIGNSTACLRSLIKYHLKSYTLNVYYTLAP